MYGPEDQGVMAKRVGDGLGARLLTAPEFSDGLQQFHCGRIHRLTAIGETRGSHTPKTSNANFWIGPRWWRGEMGALNRADGVLDLEGLRVTS